MPEANKQRAVVIGKELYEDGGNDAMENMFYSIEFRIKEEIDKDASQYRSWWNNISNEWKY
jgi:hypothetical protein